ncbi:MAG: response regulator [Acidimicrobiia bacterium]|nr:response regulator [Acidimicrobiia bacterium]
MLSFGCSQPRRILIVDDNAVNRLVATKMVEKLGYDYDVVSDGAKAVEAAARTAYSLILMDLNMPEMDGFQATGEIRRQESGGLRTPVIACTAASVTVDREWLEKSGLDDLLLKPFDLNQLSVVLSKWLA